MVADELRRQADIFLDIAELQSKVGRDPSERPVREPREPRQTMNILNIVGEPPFLCVTLSNPKPIEGAA